MPPEEEELEPPEDELLLEELELELPPEELLLEELEELEDPPEELEELEELLLPFTGGMVSVEPPPPQAVSNTDTATAATVGNNL